ncbi:MAG TPA: hypothetical protein VEF04_07765 [Blastocatellia bacterium]|nr:hypothetical protein [Blastocatellia bacterium]
MFCPNCGVQTNAEIKYCKQCGTNLRGVQEVMVRGGSKDFDWSKTWVAEMFMTEEERERRQGITPEIKRLNEIKGGVITSFVGIGVMIFLYFLLGAVAEQPGNAHDAEIIKRVWLAGLIPFLVGLGIIFNGYFVGRRIVELQKQRQASLPPMPQMSQMPQMNAVTTSQLNDNPQQTLPYSVTDQTTALLEKRPQANVSASGEGH